MTGREILFETVRLGNLLKVSAIDGATGIEASVVGRAAGDPAALRGLALRKLTYLLTRSERLHETG
ncbi:MAG: hypothetical protein JWL84_4698 [Rhodospirillales bacterium]|nr:hypothetical protein [Rhodospirillales bacterium]